MSIDAKMSEKQVTVTEVVLEPEEEMDEGEEREETTMPDAQEATTITTIQSPRVATPVLTPPAQEASNIVGESSPGPRHQAAFVNKLYTYASYLITTRTVRLMS